MRLNSMYSGLIALLVVAPLPLMAAPSLQGFDLHTSYEEWELPDSQSAGPEDEVMGMAGFGLRKWVAPYSFIGADAYTAVKGDRGGFITLGVTAGTRQLLFWRLGLDLGVHLGAGGGAGGLELAGGGLLLRGNAGLSLNMDELGTLSAGVSWVDFPNKGSVGGDQIYVSYNYSFESMLGEGWSDTRRHYGLSKLGIGETGRRHQFGVLLRELSAEDSNVVTRSGVPQADFGMVGAHWRSFIGRYGYLSFEGVGAMRGGSSGYMHLLAGAGVHYPLGRYLALNAGMAAGGGGGGAVDTGGGLLLDAQVGISVALSQRWRAELNQTRLWAPDTDFVVQGPRLLISRAFGQAEIADAELGQRRLVPHALRFRVGNQQYEGVDASWRNRIPEQDVQNLTLQFDYFVSPATYLSGQGIAAYAGEAGAYMSGQVGAGHRLQLAPRWWLQGEALVGAAGGGGLATAGGLVGQVNAGLNWQFSRSIGLTVSLGRLQSLDGGMKVDVLGASIDYYFETFSLGLR